MLACALLPSAAGSARAVIGSIAPVKAQFRWLGGNTHFPNPDCSVDGTGVVAFAVAPARIERQVAAIRGR
jgi:hypothetical protein